MRAFPVPPTRPGRPAGRQALVAAAAALLVVWSVIIAAASARAAAPPPPAGWSLVWSDDFAGRAGSPVSSGKWLYDVGTSYPGGAPNWGTGEVETMTRSTANVYRDGAGHLVIKPIQDSLQQPNVSGAAAAGYWPAFWILGAPFRGNYWNWPSVGEMDIMEDVNGLSAEFATLHCGFSIPGTCNEKDGISSGQRPCPGCQTGFHTYALEWDQSVSPQQLRWYLDGVNFYTLRQDQVDAAEWTAATDHGYMIIL